MVRQIELPTIRDVAALWSVFVKDAHYHPERHYMRGPGPKWRAKHDDVSVQPAIVSFDEAKARCGEGDQTSLLGR
jgi:hypothetical protein